MREMKDKPSRHLSLVEPSGEIKLFVQSNDPDTFGDEDVTIPSVIAELTYNFKQYQVDSDSKKVDWLFLTNYPEKARRVVETLRYQVKFSKAPGAQVTIVCCVSLGLARLHASGAIRRLSNLCGTYKRMRKTGSLIEGFVGKYFDMEIACEVGGKPARVRIPPDVKNQISLISGETGLTKSSIGILALYATLIQQDNTPIEFAREWQEELDNALELVECKYKGAMTIMEMIK